MLTPAGKVSRYLYGIDFAPYELRLALVEAGTGKIGSPVDQALLYCYHYDPASGTYGFAIMNIVRLGGILTLAGHRHVRADEPAASIAGPRRRQPPPAHRCPLDDRHSVPSAHARPRRRPSSTCCTSS